MAKENEVYIIQRGINLEVAVPEKYAWNFMENFRHVFPQKNYPESSIYLKACESGYVIKIRILDKEEKILKSFLREFCAERNLSFYKTK
ncbi:MAG: hypothetical protein PHT40_01655 [Patescibacteria group bacterium]|nr:hypothetical protein [Patescibacteria group bacterium]